MPLGQPCQQLYEAAVRATKQKSLTHSEFPAALQIYAVCSELINMYENYRVPISQEECRRLLAAVRPPNPVASAPAVAPQQ